MNNVIRIIIVDDHPLVLSGLAFIVSQVDSMVLEQTFTQAEPALAFVKQQEVDVVLLDIHMPGINGITACEEIKKIRPECHVIALSNSNEGSIIARMLHSGASGYVLKNASSEELLSAIERAYQGDQVLSDELREILHQKPQEIPFVTRREKEVLRLLAEGRTTPEIAEQMFISPLTVESHRRNLLQKFSVSNSASLIHKATEQRFI